MELVRVERARLPGQFFRTALHALVKLRHKLAAWSRKNLQVPAEKPHGLQLLVGKSIGGNGGEAVAFDRADHRE